MPSVKSNEDGVRVCAMRVMTGGLYFQCFIDMSNKELCSCRFSRCWASSDTDQVSLVSWKAVREKVYV